MKVFFNSNSGTTIAEAVNVQHSSIFGICDDVRYIAQLSYNVIINSHNGKLTLHVDLHASYIGAIRREGRTIIGAKSNLLYSEILKFEIQSTISSCIHTSSYSTDDSCVNLFFLCAKNMCSKFQFFLINSS